MSVLVTFGSKRGGTAEIASAIADVLRQHGLTVDCLPAASVVGVAGYEAVIVGGGLYAGRWVRPARRFVSRHACELEQRPVWMFSSGPLDASAGRARLPPTPRVAALMARVGARDHATFGGRLARDARGFPAAAMAKTRAGDWRDWEQIRAWAGQVADLIATLPRRVAAPPLPRPRHWSIAALLFTAGVALLVVSAVELTHFRTASWLWVVGLVVALATMTEAARFPPRSASTAGTCARPSAPP